MRDLVDECLLPTHSHVCIAHVPASTFWKNLRMASRLGWPPPDFETLDAIQGRFGVPSWISSLALRNATASACSHGHIAPDFPTFHNCSKACWSMICEGDRGMHGRARGPAQKKPADTKKIIRNIPHSHSQAKHNIHITDNEKHNTNAVYIRSKYNSL